MMTPSILLLTCHSGNDYLAQLTAREGRGDVSHGSRAEQSVQMSIELVNLPAWRGE